ncbi:unnamed protein product [Vicia faba]|uniref:Uncharacterized protein n=1 Tax=Vicia faba TaxID=3906 RepID=A0AAV1BA14_VICFA|nr:unnamed protein product [Vicia faba]
MAQQQQHRDDLQHISRTNDSEINDRDIRKNDGIFGTGAPADPVALYAYETTGNAPGIGAGVGDMPEYGANITTTTEYTAVYGTTAAPGFGAPMAGAAAGGGVGPWGQEANADLRAAAGGQWGQEANTGRGSAAGGGQRGQEANVDRAAAGVDNTGKNKNMNVGRDQK